MYFFLLRSCTIDFESRAAALCFQCLQQLECVLTLLRMQVATRKRSSQPTHGSVTLVVKPSYLGKRGGRLERVERVVRVHLLTQLHLEGAHGRILRTATHCEQLPGKRDRSGASRPH